MGMRTIRTPNLTTITDIHITMLMAMKICLESGFTSSQILSGQRL
jgi:hypothetical protein